MYVSWTFLSDDRVERTEMSILQTFAKMADVRNRISHLDGTVRFFMEVNVTTVFLAAMITALCTGLGALPFFVLGTVSKGWLGFGNSLAAGLMLGASIGLGVEAAGESVSGLSIGLAAGAVMMVVAGLLFPEPDLEAQATVAQSRKASVRKMFLIMVAMTAHSFAEGIGVGVSFGGREGLGQLITAAIAIHNIPEGLAIALVMVPRGVSVGRAAWWSVFSSLPQPLMAVPAFMFVMWFKPFLPIGLGLAAGAMIYMIAHELVPEALENLKARSVAIVVAIATVVMLTFQFLLT